MWSSPRLAALERYADVYVQAAHARGASPDVAPDLAAHLRAAGLCTSDEVAAVTRERARAAESDEWQVTLPLVVQVSGRIPE